MATHNINNYINELLNEVHEPGHGAAFNPRFEDLPKLDAEKDRQMYPAQRGDNVQIVKDRQAEMDRRRQEAEQEYASGRRFFDPTKNPMDGIRDDQKPTKKPLSSEERELAILRAQAKSRTNSMGERLAARKALKAMENQAAPAKTIGDMGKEMDKMRDGFLSNLDNFTSGKGITDNLQASDSGKKRRKATRIPETQEKIPERRPGGTRPIRDIGIGDPIRDIGGMRPRPIGDNTFDIRPGDIGGMGGPNDPALRPPGGRFPGGMRPIGTKKPESRESFPSRGGKNKRLAIAAQADKTGDAYMAQVMGQGKGTSSSVISDKLEVLKGDIRMRDGASPIRTGGPIRDLGYALPPSYETARDTFNRGGGPNIMPVNKPAIAGQKPRSLSGEIESDFIDYRKPKRMR